MNTQRTDRRLLSLSFLGFGLMSLSFLLMPLEGAGIAPGLMFWLGLALGTGLLLALERRRKAFFRAYRTDPKKMQKPHVGLLTFGSNKAAQVADLALAASLLAVLVALVLTRGHGYVCYVAISALSLSLSFHCILNGRIYFHTKNQHKVRQMLDRKKANSLGKGEGNDEKE